MNKYTQRNWASIGDLQMQRLMMTLTTRIQKKVNIMMSLNLMKTSK